MASEENQWNKPSINKDYDDAFLYAMLLSTSHIFPMALNAAIELNLFDIIAKWANRDGYISPSEIASQLPTKNPDAPFLLDRMLQVWRHFKDAILEEGILFNKVYGTPNVFQYMEADPTLNTLFNKAMVDLAGVTMKQVLETYKGFEGVSLLVDVAGINFDLPHVIQHAPSYPGIQHVGGDMYVSVPEGGTIIIKGTLFGIFGFSCYRCVYNALGVMELYK
ncbi:hypothetical protein SLA2020_365650 [Shorea laevis]